MIGLKEHHCKLWTGITLQETYRYALESAGFHADAGDDGVTWVVPDDVARAQPVWNTAHAMEQAGVAKNLCNVVRMYGKTVSGNVYG